MEINLIKTETKEIIYTTEAENYNDDLFRPDSIISGVKETLQNFQSDIMSLDEFKGFVLKLESFQASEDDIPRSISSDGLEISLTNHKAAILMCESVLDLCHRLSYDSDKIQVQVMA
ncbi:MAG: hypothetical protein QME81_05620 [bacterium]|nr:hypothetical protein [bacterium]